MEALKNPAEYLATRVMRSMMTEFVFETILRLAARDYPSTKIS
jgi:predicted secreted protein